MTREQQAAYWRINLTYVVTLLAIWASVSFGGAIVFADALDRYALFGFPLGFWFGHQGAVLTFVALVFVYVGLMNRLDKRFGVYER